MVSECFIYCSIQCIDFRVEPDAPQTMLAFFQKIGTEAEIPKCSFFKNKNVKHVTSF